MKYGLDEVAEEVECSLCVHCSAWKKNTEWYGNCLEDTFPNLDRCRMTEVYKKLIDKLKDIEAMIDAELEGKK